MKIGLAALAAVLSVMAVPVFADGAQDMGAGAMKRPPYAFQGGKAIYSHVCQGCHMVDAKGAVGAGRYPALARNAKLETPGIRWRGHAWPEGDAAFGRALHRSADRRCGQLCPRHSATGIQTRSPPRM